MNKPFAFATLILTASLSFGQAAAGAPAAPADPSPADIGYSFGLLMAQSLKSTGLDYDLASISQGLNDALAQGTSPKWTADEAKTLLTGALAAVRAKAEAVQKSKEESWLAVHAQLPGVTTTASGLQYEVLTQGSGAKPTASDTVTVNYSGKLIDGTEFDSTASRGEPAEFPVGEVIPAWTEGLQLMGVGDKFRFTIPSALAYGSEGAGGGVIPPYATLIFEVELLSIKAPEAAPAQ